MTHDAPTNDVKIDGPPTRHQIAAGDQISRDNVEVRLSKSPTFTSVTTPGS
ncbi:hypothetical protein [Mycolicibacterium sp.]|uniref:hypothetical protein n=1 Tax=Mycolicibacterium sp. TaxID=2320850 RepID=UPI001A1FD248|nr:hypothetical protein [Mycolicibacterium sp.]MBJ7340969.1 hypothetical protein [Mycolicibacterium sp.]